MDYKNGKIYKITSDSTDKIYIGSTCQLLCRRMNEHRSNYKRFQNGKFSNMTSYELIALGDAIITLIEDYPCERKEQLHARERYHIELNKDICVNKFIPTRTDKEYREANKEHLAQIGKEYREVNKDKIKEVKKTYYDANKEKIKERVREYRETNKQVINKKPRHKITCECGKQFLINNKPRHEKSEKHLAYIQSNS
jgi:hypothetical protein